MIGGDVRPAATEGGMGTGAGFDGGGEGGRTFTAGTEAEGVTWEGREEKVDLKVAGGVMTRVATS